MTRKLIISLQVTSKILTNNFQPKEIGRGHAQAKTHGCRGLLNWYGERIRCEVVK